jgi:putative DNA methylase
MTESKKKLIEVALPLKAINTTSAREKSIRHGHPSTLHLWWARRPLAAARAVIFAQMVDDPSAHPDLFPTEKKQEKERLRLFRIIEELVKWENTTNEQVLQAARDEIWQSWRYTCAEYADHPRAKELFDRNRLPAFHDPFAGGGALPLEAQRLGLEAYASDLNPVAVLINKVMIEIPPKFAGKPPVHPADAGAASAATRNSEALFKHEWKVAQGLAEDVRHYGQWMRDEAEKRIGHLYPKIEITPEMIYERPDLKQYAGRKLTVIAWLWARTVKSPNPAFAQVDVPLASTFLLSTKAGKEAYVEPVIEDGGYCFTVKVGKPKDAAAAKNGTKLSRGANFQCLMSGTPIAGDYIKAEGKAGRMGARLMAIVAEGDRGRVYLAPTPEHEEAALRAKPEWKPEGAFVEDARAFTPCIYGITEWQHLFTNRQLVALTTFSDLVQEARERVRRDALAAGIPDDKKPLGEGGTGATAYAEAVGVCLSMCVSRQANRSATLNIWDQKGENVQQAFGMQALRMTWDFVEGNPLSSSTGNFNGQIEYFTKVLEVSCSGSSLGNAEQSDAQTQTISTGKVVSTDPPYYDNVPYADLSDFFYIWLRRSLRSTFPELFATLAVPKAEELVAFAYRHENKIAAEAFFLDGMTRVMHCLAEQAHPAFPVTIYYAFKQAESETDEGTASTGWETFLDAVIRAGFATSGTWPMRTEYTGNLKTKRNALASSIILVCRPRATSAPTATRREFVTALKAELPQALAHLQRGNIAPVDLAQAAIGPGMAVYTRYCKVLDAEGKPLTVREALALINQTLDEALAEQEGDFDADTRWALVWFEQQGFAEGEYGVAEQLSKSKNTSVAGMVEAGILESRRGKVRLLRPEELPADWDPATDPRLTAWEMVHHLIRALEIGGEATAATLVAKLGSKSETARELAYRLYTLCERKKRAQEALSYNGLVQSWPEIERLTGERRRDPELGAQGGLFQ